MWSRIRATIALLVVLGAVLIAFGSAIGTAELAILLVLVIGALLLIWRRRRSTA